ncbi:hypothetical protein E3N88_15723 [Mikania micrantha]|uniref:Retrotransposon gag domain-containing protein n=1 Tax=Mikania micrantha TaxID=192012 RepID=A0A5N6NYH1_9ASTR|nr:hypothetical protein E3N88_15723 [Mikania micrantha]
MWWDGFWAGRRLDPGVCPIYKHTDLDITCGVNKIKVLPKGVLLKLFKLINYMNSPTIVLTLFLLHAFSGDAQTFLTLMLCKQSDQPDYHPRYRAPGTFRLTGTSDPTPPARGVTDWYQSSRMPPRKQPTTQTSAPHSSTPSPADSPPPPPPPPPPPHSPPPGSSNVQMIDPATIALATLLSTQLTNQLKDVIPEMINRIQGHGNTSGHTTGEASGNTIHTSDCSYKSFVGCKPPSFTGAEGAVGLIQWLEKMENTLDISSCPEHHKVRYAAGSFSKRALTWWNAQIRAKGRDETMTMPWT